VSMAVWMAGLGEKRKQGHPPCLGPDAYLQIECEQMRLLFS
jgi:hypothetical protein